MSRLAVANGVAWRMLHNFFSNKSLLLPSLVFPLFFFTAFVGFNLFQSSLTGFCPLERILGGAHLFGCQPKKA